MVIICLRCFKYSLKLASLSDLILPIHPSTSLSI